MIKNFPKLIPIFPLNGVIYFPKTNLPLNIFEQRYLDLVNDVMKNNKMMGMVQTKKDGDEVYNVGCLGKISDYKKSEDGRILINLTGVTRFEIKKEINNEKKYREFEVAYEKYSGDVIKFEEEMLEKNELEKFRNKIKDFFNNNGLNLNWKEFEKLEIGQQIHTLAMIAPISNEEKQKLIETINLKETFKTLVSISDFYRYEENIYKKTLQ